jgi:hypothetical protein
MISDGNNLNVLIFAGLQDCLVIGFFIRIRERLGMPFQVAEWIYLKSAPVKPSAAWQFERCFYGFREFHYSPWCLSLNMKIQSFRQRTIS